MLQHVARYVTNRSISICFQVHAARHARVMPWLRCGNTLSTSGLSKTSTEAWVEDSLEARAAMAAGVRCASAQIRSSHCTTGHRLPLDLYGRNSSNCSRGREGDVRMLGIALKDWGAVPAVMVLGLAVLGRLRGSSRGCSPEKDETFGLRRCISCSAPKRNRLRRCISAGQRLQGVEYVWDVRM